MLCRRHIDQNVLAKLTELINDEEVAQRFVNGSWDEGPTPYEHWLDTPDHLYVIANTFNFCVVLTVRLGSTTVLPLYSNMNCIAGMLCIGFISDPNNISYRYTIGCPLPPMQVQWQYHREVSVSGWTDPYYERFAEWVRKLSNLTGPCQASGNQLERESQEEYSLDSVAEDDYEGGTTVYNHQCKHWEE
ncbi:hypothetical protein M9H77_18431 [Catharanthus roseus]|uniref:Uncharacterized protein n=1 Tax=Catharanthus roseus TaxID=4058 RepID=A0ACC0B7H2_CATRO|nr:hypothetical protein M9H77_18431 [Catharanthus roseus]